jgi:hypothetical protein
MVFGLDPNLRDGRMKRIGVFFATLGGTCGLWFVRNLLLYGNLTGFAAQVALAGNGRPAWDPFALVREWSGFFKSSWGVFGAFNVVYPEPVYYGFAALTCFLFVSFAVWMSTPSARRMTARWTLVAMIAINLAAVAWWTSRLLGSQGRFMFPSIAATSLLAMASLAVLGSAVASKLRLAIVALLFLAALFAFAGMIPRSYLYA